MAATDRQEVLSVTWQWLLLLSYTKTALQRRRSSREQQHEVCRDRKAEDRGQQVRRDKSEAASGGVPGASSRRTWRGCSCWDWVSTSRGRASAEARSPCRLGIQSHGRDKERGSERSPSRGATERRSCADQGVACVLGCLYPSVTRRVRAWNWPWWHATFPREAKSWLGLGPPPESGLREAVFRGGSRGGMGSGKRGINNRPSAT